MKNKLNSNKNIRFIKLLFLIITLEIFYAPVLAQTSNEIKANQLFEKKSYKQAIPLYLKALSKDTSLNTPIYNHLADCYLKIDDHKSAEIWFEKLYKTEKISPEKISDYVNVLRHNNKNEKADFILQQYEKKNKAGWEEYEDKGKTLEFQSSESSNTNSDSLPSNNYILKGIVYSENLNDKLKDVIITLESSVSKIEYITTESGHYKFDIIDTLNYELILKKEDFYTDTLIVTKGWMAENYDQNLNIELEKTSDIRFVFTILDSKTNKPLENVKFNFVQQPSFKEYKQGLTNTSGQFKKAIRGARVGDKYQFAVHLEKKGYATKSFKIQGSYKKGNNIYSEQLIEQKEVQEKNPKKPTPKKSGQKKR